jgi:hypothetical protein
MREETGFLLRNRVSDMGVGERPGFSKKKPSLWERPNLTTNANLYTMVLGIAYGCVNAGIPLCPISGQNGHDGTDRRFFALG